MHIAADVEQRLEAYYREEPGAPRPVVAVMGCMVNGPGEAREADLALVGGCDKFALYVNGQHHRSIPQAQAVDALMEAVKTWSARN